MGRARIRATPEGTSRGRPEGDTCINVGWSDAGPAVSGQEKILSVPSLPKSPVFSKGRSKELLRLRLSISSIHFPPHILLLLLSGQCPNPGPASPCGVCTRNVTRRYISFRCTSCQLWVHSACCSLRTRGDYEAFNGTWMCPTCNPVQPAIAPQNPPIPLSVSPGGQAAMNQPAPHPIPLASSPGGRAALAQGHFLQFNTNGITNSRQEINDLLKQQDILVACIQETKLTSNSATPIFDKYTVERRDRPVGGAEG